MTSKCSPSTPASPDKAAMETFLVELDNYAGPLDLLLFLVRRSELPPGELSLAAVCSQYLSFIDVLEAIDVDGVGDFLEVASVLLEMKAKAVLPKPVEAEAAAAPQEQEDDSLVERLLEYKRFRDIASVLEDRAADWQLRYARLAQEPPNRAASAEDQPVERVEIWDLVSAFGRILRERQPAPSETVVYDDTPIDTHMKQIHQLVARQRRVELQELFELGQHKSTLVGMFLATLELTRHHGLVVEQTSSGGPLILSAGEAFPSRLQIAEAKNVAVELLDRSNFAYRPR